MHDFNMANIDLGDVFSGSRVKVGRGVLAWVEFDAHAINYGEHWHLRS